LPQKVLSIISTLWRCGPTSVLHGIVRNYDHANYQARVATLSPNPSDSALEDFHSIGIPVEKIDLSRLASLLVGPQRLRAMIQALKIDLVHCHGFRADVLFHRCGLQVPAVSTIHADYWSDYQLLYGKVLGRWMARREFAALHEFDCVTAVSETVAAAVHAHGLQCKVIANGVDLNTYHPSTSLSAKRLLRERLHLPLGQIVVLHTGSLTVRKRPVEVVAGFLGSSLARNAMLVFAGEGPLRRQCEQAAAGAKNIHFLGKRQDIPDLLRASDVLISNSISEGLPLALLEGCACGTHLIASDILPHRHIRDMFPQQVFLYSGHGPQAVSAVLDASAREDMDHVLQPPRESLEAISALRMSRAYQRVYDDLGARDTRSERTATRQN